MADVFQFSSAIVNFSFSKGDWTLDYTQFWGFSEIPLFPKILSFKLFGNSWENFYILFLVIII